MGGVGMVPIPGTSCTGAPILATWWPLFVAVGVKAGLTRPYLVQGFVAYSTVSGWTHADGTAFDLGTTVPAELAKWARLARTFGAPGTWPRGPLWGQRTMAYHVHGQLEDPATVAGRWQLDEVYAGGDGLTGSLRDYLSPAAPPARITALAGIAAMRAILTTTPKETDEMTYLFMRTVEPLNPIYILTPGVPPRRLTKDEWALWVRLGATTPGGDFNRLEVDMVNSTIQPQYPAIEVPANLAELVADKLTVTTKGNPQ